jgi:hypothetical protein
MAQRRNVPLLPRTLIISPDIVAQAIRDGDSWFFAWLRQMSTPYAKLSRLTGMSAGRFDAINHGDYVTRAEVEALAKAWGATPDALIQSMPDPSLVVETKWSSLPSQNHQIGKIP